jgi:quinol monooxygenase YgiN
MIHVVATVELQEGKREAFLAEFRKIVPLVHAEAGCIEYGAAVDVATDISVQVPLGKDVVLIIEKWASLPALQAHLGAAHMVAYRPKIRDFVRSVKLAVLQPV